MTLCAWGCGAEATFYRLHFDLVPACSDHESLSAKTDAARGAMAGPWLERVRFGGEIVSDASTMAHARAVARRDAVECRGEPIDWSAPVEGWVLFGT